MRHWPTDVPAEQRWRGVVAALADPARRTLYARIVLATDEEAPLHADDLTPAEFRRLRVLTAAGVVVTIDGILRPGDPFSALLAKGGPRVPSGPERFLTGGKLLALPRRAADRDAVLGWIAGRVIERDETLDERSITERLAELSIDPVALRRYLIDAGLLVRSPDGRDYRPGPGQVRSDEPG